MLKVEEGVHGKRQSSLSCWSTSKLNRVSMQKSVWSRVESQGLSKLRKVSKWKGCVMWVLKAERNVYVEDGDRDIGNQKSKVRRCPQG